MMDYVSNTDSSNFCANIIHEGQTTQFDTSQYVVTTNMQQRIQILSSYSLEISTVIPALEAAQSGDVDKL